MSLAVQQASLSSLFVQGSPAVTEGELLFELWLFRNGYRPYSDWCSVSQILDGVDASLLCCYHRALDGFASHQQRVGFKLTWNSIVSHAGRIGKLRNLAQKGRYVAASEDEF